MREFLIAKDIPNWACVLLWLLAYLHTLVGERLESLRQARFEEKWDQEETP